VVKKDKNQEISPNIGREPTANREGIPTLHAKRPKCTEEGRGEGGQWRKKKEEEPQFKSFEE